MIPELLDTQRLVLRPFDKDDVNAVFDYWNSDPDWARFNRSVPANYTVQHVEKFVMELISRVRETQPNWAVTLDETVVGIVSLTFEQGHRIAVIGYGIHGALRGQGMSGEALEIVIDQAFNCYAQLRKIRAHMDSQNLGSMRVLEKLGFSREGILRSNQYVNGEFVDEAIYGILRSERSM
jgi:RimJ/RimL family protein N-acetyltransferase